MGFRLSVQGRKKLICFTKSQRVKLGLGAVSQNDCFISNISNPWSTIQLECDQERPARHMLNTTPLPSPAHQLTPLFSSNFPFCLSFVIITIEAGPGLMLFCVMLFAIIEFIQSLLLAANKDDYC